MANLQVKNVPSDVHRKLSRLAKARGTTIRDVVLDAVRRELGRLEFVERLSGRTRVDLVRPAARELEDARLERERDLGR
jgi:hypothetical protein